MESAQSREGRQVKPFRKRETVKPEPPVVVTLQAPNGTCGDCHYWRKQESLYVCKRFPVYQMRLSLDWCGEFQPKET